VTPTCETCAAWGLDIEGEHHNDPALDEFVSSCHNPDGMFENRDSSKWCTKWEAREPGTCGECKWWDWEGNLRETEWITRRESRETATQELEDAIHKGACLRNPPQGAYWFPVTLKNQRGCGDFRPRGERIMDIKLPDMDGVTDTIRDLEKENRALREKIKRLKVENKTYAPIKQALDTLTRPPKQAAKTTKEKG